MDKAPAIAKLVKGLDVSCMQVTFILQAGRLF